MAKPQQNMAPTATPEAPIAAPAAIVEQAKPKSDRYRVKGPGGVFARGKLHPAGTVLQLSDSDALSVIDHIEPVD